MKNVPLFNEKNEFQSSISLGAGKEIICKDAQVAYSLTNHIGLMANYMYASGRGGSENGYGNYIDGAIGYYNCFKNHTVLEIYSGYGSSSQFHYWGPTSAELSFNKLFIQPSIGFTSDAIDIAFTTSLCKLEFTQVDTIINHSMYITNSNFKDIKLIEKNRNYYLIEPAITLRGGWKYFKVQIQYGWMNNMTIEGLKFENSHFSIGLVITLASRFNRESKQ